VTLFSVRNARTEDIEHIVPWTRETFDWGDYVADSISQWMANPDLRVLVAAGDDDIPKAVSVVQLLSPREGWLSAARVHPGARRQGLGTLLNAASVEWIRENGGEVARLAVEDPNEAANNQVVKLGYRPGSKWIYAEPPENQPRIASHGDKPTVVGRSDVDPAWMYWSTSEMADAGRMLMPSAWKWRRATASDIDRAARERRLISNSAGWLVFEIKGDDSIEVVWVAAGQNDVPWLIDAALLFAADNGINEVYFKIPETGWTGEALRREGFDV
jgi:ribosomal protein S18 acetylase RimI-like enzyme